MTTPTPQLVSPERAATLAQASLMHKEAAQAPFVVRELLAKNQPLFDNLANKMAALSPRFIVTCARGSSDHAATYGKYILEKYIGLPVLSYAPSISSIYQSKVKFDGCLFIAISQSGASPDILSALQSAKASGAYTVAITNSEDAPLAQHADMTIPLHAGAECSVAATKSYITSIVALCALTAAWSKNTELHNALNDLPTALETAWSLDWRKAEDQLQSTTNMFVIGRGTGLGIAQEAALKFKECTGIHAEAFSAAEFKHGPMALLQPGIPMLIFGQNDKTLPSITGVTDLAERHCARVLAAVPGRQDALPTVALHPDLDPVLLIQSFYKMICTLAFRRGFDPDTPDNLKKVTETV